MAAPVFALVDCNNFYVSCERVFQPRLEARPVVKIQTESLPARLYARFYGRKDAKLDVPENPLLYVPTHTARDLDRDLQAAGIQKYTLGGKLDFHGCRVAYINFVIESGVASKRPRSLPVMQRRN
jgi:nucleotidyltransferase/DNA polymerase involved in DNA repair